MLTRALSATRRLTLVYPSVVRAYSQSTQNQAIIDLLGKHKKQEEQNSVPNSFKINAFVKAIRIISKLDYPIRSGQQISQLQGIGAGIANRINEYLIEEGHLNDHQEALQTRALSELQKIPGIGRIKAKALVEAGCMGIADLVAQKFTHLLSPSQLIGVKYMKHLDKPVEREEAEQVVAFCRENLCPKYEYVVVGDYRRGAITSPEISVILLHPDVVHVPMPTESPPNQATSLKKKPPLKKLSQIKANLTAKARKSCPLHSNILPLFKERGLIAETLGVNVGMWQGIVRLPGLEDQRGSRMERLEAIANTEGQYRRMVIHLIPQKSRATAMLALTGDSEFNRDIRAKASQLGMLLNLHGLWKWHPNKDEVTVESQELDAIEEDHSNTGFWGLAKTLTEQDIFAELGMEYIDPHKRNFEFIMKSKTFASSKK